MPEIVGQNGRRLILDAALPGVPGEPGGSYSATLEMEGGTVTRTVYEHGGNGLARYFGDLSSSCRGWSGTKTFESLEGELWLSATHDGLGTVNLIVTVRQPWPPEWSATAVLDLGAGAHLEAVLEAISGWDKRG